jgi:hypothetical protein
VKLDKNTEVSLKRKKEKREKEFEPPVEKPSHLKQQQQSTTDRVGGGNCIKKNSRRY